MLKTALMRGEQAEDFYVKNSKFKFAEEVIQINLQINIPFL